MKYIYLLFSLIILYLLYCYYKKYNDQENFDPSLVPVSSIVTLAKVAQKLVDGGGTLTNPGNLQIGLPSAGALGNLYVTGTNTVDGNTTINGTTTINSLLTTNAGISTTNIGATNNIAANSFSTTNGNVSINNGTINLTSDGTGGLYFLNSGTTASPVYNRLYMGPTNVTGNFNASGNVEVKGTLQINDKLKIGNKAMLLAGPDKYASDNIVRLMNSDNTDYADGFVSKVLYSQQDTIVGKNLNVKGNLTTNTLSHDEFMQLKLMLRVFKYNSPVRSITQCTESTPVIALDGWNTSWDATSYIFPVGDHQTLDIEWPYCNNGEGGKLRVTNSANDRMNFVYIYPGYGFKGWTGYSYMNDNNGYGNNPLSFENRTGQIMYYNLYNGRDSSDDNIKNFGVNLHDPDGGGPPSGVPSCWDSLSSCKVYKLTN